eukprot:GHVH01012053.1.p1 GENE.GHVH01012053.1~~GHVH01012053.1.p1  ORF type:complete len:500 (-),score=58.27 GHVH01012053.1:148-1647(-)
MAHDNCYSSQTGSTTAADDVENSKPLLDSIMWQVKDYLTGPRDSSTPPESSESSPHFQIENCLKWLFSAPNTAVDFQELLMGRNKTGVSEYEHDNSRKMRLIILIFSSSVAREFESHGAWSWNHFVCLKVVAAALITLFPKDIVVLNIVTRVLLTVRNLIADDECEDIGGEGCASGVSGACRSANTKSLDSCDDCNGTELMDFLCGLHQGIPSIGNISNEMHSYIDSRNPETEVLSSLSKTALNSRLCERLIELIDRLVMPWKTDQNSPTIEALEQQSRTVLVYGEPHDGVLHIIMAVLKKRRQNKQKMTVIVVIDETDPRRSYLNTISEGLMLLHRNSHKVDASLVVIPYSAVGNVMAIVDRVVIGVKQCFNNGSALAFQGTKSLCLIAKNYNKTVVALSTIVRVAPFSYEEFCGSDALCEEELLDSDDLSFYVTPIGMLPPTAMKNEIGRHLHSRDKVLVKLFLGMTAEDGERAYTRLTDLQLVEDIHGLQNVRGLV